MDKTIKKGAVYIDNTTASATIAKEIYDYAKKNEFGFLGHTPTAIFYIIAIILIANHLKHGFLYFYLN